MAEHCMVALSEAKTCNPFKIFVRDENVLCCWKFIIVQQGLSCRNEILCVDAAGCSVEQLGMETKTLEGGQWQPFPHLSFVKACKLKSPPEDN